LVAIFLFEVIAHHYRTERWFRIEITDGVERRDADIARLDWIAVIASPEGREAGS